jgi:hypothetical protein
MIIYIEKPEGTVSMKEIVSITGALTETLRGRLRKAKVIPIGLLKVGCHKTNLYIQAQVQHILDDDYSNHKKQVRYCKRKDVDTLEHPFSNTLALQVIRGGL